MAEREPMVALYASQSYSGAELDSAGTYLLTRAAGRCRHDLERRLQELGLAYLPGRARWTLRVEYDVEEQLHGARDD